MLFDDYEKDLTLDKCRDQFSADELQKLKEFGQNVVVSQKSVTFGDDQSSELMIKFNSLFSRWIDSQVRHKTDIHGMVVEMSVRPQELKARQNFPEVDAIYSGGSDPADIETDINFSVWGLLLTFIQGLGIDIQIKKATGDAEKLTMVIFDENTAQLQVTHKKYSGALSPKKNRYAYIVDIDRQLQFVWDEDGTPRITTAAEAEAVDGLLKRKAIPAKCADTDLLATLAAAVKGAYHYNIGDRITVYLPNFAKALGIRIDNDAKKDNSHFDFWGKIKQLENIGGVLVEQGKLLRAFVFLGYDQKENTLTFASPYLYSLMDILQKNPAKIAPKNQWKNKKPSYEIKGLSYLIDAKIISARNKVTSEVVKCLIAGLMQRGSKPDASFSPNKQYQDRSVISYSIKYRELVNSVPMLKEALTESKSDKRSQTLKRAIFGDKFDGINNTTPIVETYMRTYTDAFNYWKSLEINVQSVSMKELDNTITLTHYGLNGNFKPRFHIPRPADQVDIDAAD